MRRFPRNAQNRADALAGPGHLFQNYRRDALGRKSEDARYAQTAAGVVAIAAGGTAHACNESDIVAGGKVLTITLSGPDRFTNNDNWAAFLAALPTTDTINTGFDAAHISLSTDGKVITATLLAIAGYTISADASYDIPVPASYFNSANAALTMTAAIVVTNGA